MLSDFYYCYSFILASFTFSDLSDSDLPFKMQIKCFFLRWLFITFLFPSYPLGYTHTLITSYISPAVISLHICLCHKTLSSLMARTPVSIALIKHRPWCTVNPHLIFIEWIRFKVLQWLNAFPAWCPCARVGARSGTFGTSPCEVSLSVWPWKDIVNACSWLLHPPESSSQQISKLWIQHKSHWQVQGKADSKSVSFTWQKPDLPSPAHSSDLASLRIFSLSFEVKP